MCRRFFAYLILFLCIGVAGRELPECMSLGDDVSNDSEGAVYYVQSSREVSSCADSRDPGRISAFGKASLSLILPSPRSSRVAAPFAHAGVALLRLIDQQRR